MAVAPQQQAPNLPPQDLDAEESVLGAMLVSPTAVAVVSEVLHPEDFYLGSHAHIYRTILEMYGAGETIDSITLTNALTSRGLLDQVGGKAVVHTLAATVPAAANAAPLRPDRARRGHLPLADPRGHRDRDAGLRPPR